MGCRSQAAHLQLFKELVYSKKASQNFRREWRKKVKYVISGGVYVGNDTSHDGRGRAAVMKPPCQKSPLGFFESLKMGCRSQAAHLSEFAKHVPVFAFGPYPSDG